MSPVIPFSLEDLEAAKQKAISVRSAYVELHMSTSQLKPLVDKLQAEGEGVCLWHLTLQREDGDRLSGEYVADLKRLGVHLIRTELHLTPSDAERTMYELHFLRECATHYVEVEWTPAAECTVDCEQLVHLAPPAEVGVADSDWASTWQQKYSQEGCRYRRGPEMIVIRDQRRTGVGQIIHLDEPQDHQLFWLTREPKKRAEILSVLHQEQLKTWLDLNLLVQVEEWVLNLVTPANRKVIPYL